MSTRGAIIKDLHHSCVRVHVVGRLVGLHHTQSGTLPALLRWVSDVVYEDQGNALGKIEFYDFWLQLLKY